MIVYPNQPENEMELILFLRRELPNLQALRKVQVSPEGVKVFDVNQDTIEFPGLTYGNPLLESVLKELGVVFSKEILHNPQATANGIKEFRLSAVYTWGHDRVM